MKKTREKQEVIQLIFSYKLLYMIQVMIKLLYIILLSILIECFFSFPRPLIFTLVLLVC